MTGMLPHDPKPVKREIMRRAARKLVAICPTCRRSLPLDPKTGRCWLCINLNSAAYPKGSTDAQSCERGTSCNDCAFRGDSPEATRELERFMHIPMPGDSERSAESVRDLVIVAAKQGSTIFWCHKPFMEAQQQWGYDATKRELTPLYGQHWKPCAGWLKVFEATWGAKGDSEA